MHLRMARQDLSLKELPSAAPAPGACPGPISLVPWNGHLGKLVTHLLGLVSSKEGLPKRSSNRGTPGGGGGCASPWLLSPSADSRCVCVLVNPRTGARQRQPRARLAAASGEPVLSRDPVWLPVDDPDRKGARHRFAPTADMEGGASGSHLRKEPEHARTEPRRLVPLPGPTPRRDHRRGPRQNAPGGANSAKSGQPASRRKALERAAESP